jgi:MFS transporter, ACDE family, multidrug resistance protein
MYNTTCIMQLVSCKLYPTTSDRESQVPIYNLKEAILLQSETQDSHKINLRQPIQVWAVAFACVIAFMGLGLVDPILTSIAKELHASASQVVLLFTSYLLVTGLMMVITGAVSSRIGSKWTLLIALLIIVIFSAFAGSSSSVDGIVWNRAGWGVGNALFIATALAVIVSVASGGVAAAVILYEAAMGLGISVGPLLGGWLGGISWRAPFYGVAILMAIGFIAIIVLLPKIPVPAKKISVLDPFKALRFQGLLTMAITAFFSNYGLFTLLAFAPFVLEMDAHGIGYVFFGWGILMAIFSVFVAPQFQKRFDVRRTMYVMFVFLALDLLGIGLLANAGTETVHLLGSDWSAHHLIIALVVLNGAFLGVNATLMTTKVMQVAPVERSVASASYSFFRFVGGAFAAYMAGKMSEWYSHGMTFYVGAVATLLCIVVMACGKKYLK